MAYEEWEYKVLHTKSGTKAAEEQAALNRLGREGWELVSTFWSGGTWSYLKRRFVQPDQGGAYRSPAS